MLATQHPEGMQGQLPPLKNDKCASTQVMQQHATICSLLGGRDGQQLLKVASNTLAWTNERKGPNMVAVAMSNSHGAFEPPHPHPHPHRQMRRFGAQQAAILASRSRLAHLSNHP